GRSKTTRGRRAATAQRARTRLVSAVLSCGPDPGSGGSMTIQTEPLSFVATAAKGKVSALLTRPEGARSLLVFGHGAGAGMRHRFMQDMSACLARAGIAT